MKRSVTGPLLFVAWLALCFWLGFAGCRCQPLPPPVPPDPVVDAGTGGAPADAGADAAPEPRWDDAQPCTSAFDRLAWVDCAPLRPESGTWLQACELARANGLTFGVGCVRGVRAKSEVPTCGITCQ